MNDPLELVDLPGSRPVDGRVVRYRGAKWDVVTDTVDLGGAALVRRDVVLHPGAVGIVAVDAAERVLLIRQYRHPVQAELWELPAGLLDVAGEAPWQCAQRELFEEAHLRAERWDVLVDVYSSPGMCSEAYRVYLARGVSAVPDHEQHEREDEERDMPVRWGELEEACAAVEQGLVHNAMAVVGLLAARRAQASGWTTLRPVDTPWPQGPRR